MDAGGNMASDEEIVHLTGDLKLGNFQLSFTDLEIPVSGIPISITRTYDTLTSLTSDDLGYGWRLEFRDTDLRTSLPAPSGEEQLLGEFPAFEEDTRVYVTVPGGRRVGFTFDPQPYNQVISQFFPADAQWYRPGFVADDGTFFELKAGRSGPLIQGVDGKFYDLAGVPYNPESGRFGGRYTLVTPEGIEYVIDAVSGDLLTAEDTNENLC